MFPKKESNILTLEYFENWVKGKPKDAIVGTTASAHACPVARMYMEVQGAKHVSVNAKYVYVLNPGMGIEVTHLTDKHLGWFVNTLDRHLRFKDVTAEEVLQIIDCVKSGQGVQRVYDF